MVTKNAHKGFNFSTYQAVEEAMRKKKKFTLRELWEEMTPQPNWYSFKNIVDYLVSEKKIKKTDKEKNTYVYRGK